jgi:flagellin
MAFVVNNNISSLNALNNLNRTNKGLASSMGKISSGLRINKAADDAAGLAVSENLDTQARSLDQASRNANDGISLIQVAEGASNEVAEIIKRMKELAVQSASETLASTERGYVQSEFTELRSEIARIATVTEFNGIGLTRGTAVHSGVTGLSSVTVQVGAFNTTDDRITISLGDLGSTSLNLQGISLNSATSAQAALSNLETALSSVNTHRAGYGSVQNRIESSIRGTQTYSENLKSAKSQIKDADFAYEAARMARNQIMQQAGTAVLAQANQINQGALRLIS